MRLTAVILLLCVAIATAQKPTLPTFMGRQVTLTVPPLDDTGFYPTAPASVCIEGPPERQCYTPPKDFGVSPRASVIQIEKNTFVLFFEVYSGGVSGSALHFALLQPGPGDRLQDIFLSRPDISNQSQHAFWNAADISPSPIFVTADFIMGMDEAHYSPHRYVVSAYVLKHPVYLDGIFYYLEDRYMSARTYALDASKPDDILAAEKPEILARLRRVKAEENRQRAVKP